MWFPSILTTALILAAGSLAAEPIPVDAEIVLAVDASASVDGPELQVQRGGYVQALRHPDLMRAVHAGRLGRVAFTYFEWWGQVRAFESVPWQIIDSAQAAADFADAISALPVRPSHGTSISRALAYGTAQIGNNDIAGRKRIIDISGDGPNNAGPPVTTARDAAVALGITINGLPVLLRPSNIFPDIDLYYDACVIGGDGAFLMAVRSAEELAPAILRKLILEVSERRVRERIVPVAAHPPVDCLTGEKRRAETIGDYYPGLYK